jgi:peptidoglycan hydrolase-like protein with peptidoglycan-binding domain
MSLKKGDSSDAVTSWQEFLLKEGFIKIPPTGFFGDKTLRATKDFQLKYGLTPDGVVGPKTVEVMKKIKLGEKIPLNTVFGEIAGVKLIAANDGSEIKFVAGAAINADGAYKAYHPKNIGLDYLQNAMSSDGSGRFVGVLTDKNGEPIIQGKKDPAPGYYVSTTSYQNSKFKVEDPRRYLDSESVVFIVMPKQFSKMSGILGCLAKITNLETGKTIFGLVGDFGPIAKIGEMSIACAKGLDLNPSPKNGGTNKKIIEYVIYPHVAPNGYEIKN